MKAAFLSCFKLRCVASHVTSPPPPVKMRSRRGNKEVAVLTLRRMQSLLPSHWPSSRYPDQPECRHLPPNNVIIGLIWCNVVPAGASVCSLHRYSRGFMAAALFVCVMVRPKLSSARCGASSLRAVIFQLGRGHQTNSSHSQTMISLCCFTFLSRPRV